MPDNKHEILDAIQAHVPEPERALLVELCSDELGQQHLFAEFPKVFTGEDIASDIRSMSQQLHKLDRGYPGGLKAYIQNAKKLLQDSKEGVNPLDGWTPSVPAGEAFELGTDAYRTTERLGMKELGSVGFVLVAGGLGERLGYKGAKIGLPTESATGTKYLQYYCEYIKALEQKASGKKRLPLCIMVSKDTRRKTEELLQENRCFGLKARQITLVTQGLGVPALMDNDAKIALDENNKFQVETKPHGHGDIHALLYKHGVTTRWANELGIKWAVMFQDTNGLAFHTLPLMLGVSVERGFIMNSLAVPRRAGQAIGGIAKLTNKDGNQRTINVEYNQLDPMLRGTKEFRDGDTNDKETGYSPFPGNINQLLFRLDGYNKVLKRTKGAMPDFVNPKYKDSSKTVFKKPTRLECMMQDFPTVLESSETKKVGFTQVRADLCFSPVKNSNPDGAALQAKGVAAGTAFTGESDQYAAQRLILKTRGVQIEDADYETYNHISAIPGPMIVLKPDFCCAPAEYEVKFPFPDRVKISKRSSLVVRGPGVTIESLDLDGALVIDVDRGEEAIVRDLIVKNEGWVRIRDEDSSNEFVKMRGFRLDRRETKYIDLRQDPKDNDGIGDIEDDETEWIIKENGSDDDMTKIDELDNCGLCTVQ